MTDAPKAPAPSGTEAVELAREVLTRSHTEVEEVQRLADRLANATLAALRTQAVPSEGVEDLDGLLLSLDVADGTSVQRMAGSRIFRDAATAIRVLRARPVAQGERVPVKLPVKPFISGRIVALMDADDREIISWTGFDSSCLALPKQKALVRAIAVALNALPPTAKAPTVAPRDERRGERRTGKQGYEARMTGEVGNLRRSYPGDGFPDGRPHDRRVEDRGREARSESVAPSEEVELLCTICGRDYPIWFAPNDLWNAVMRGGDRANADEYEFACPTCFMVKMAMERGAPVFRVTGE